MNNKEPLIIALDMDGTLLNKRKRICLKTLFYLRKLSKEGHYIILCSGRPSRSLWKYYYQLKLKTPMICYNGAYVFSPYDSNFTPHEFKFPKKMIIELLSKIKPHVYNAMCETDTEIWVDKKDKFLEKFFWYKNMEVHVGDLKEILDKDPMTCIVQTPYEYRETKDVENALKNYNQIGVRFWTGSPYFELYYKETSKANAIDKIVKYYKIPKENVIAFGDSVNDIEIFDYAGISVLMKNGKEQIKNADMITKKDNNHNGIYYTLKEILK